MEDLENGQELLTEGLVNSKRHGMAKGQSVSHKGVTVMPMSASPPPNLQNYEIAIALAFREKQKVLLSSTAKTRGQVLI